MITSRLSCCHQPVPGGAVRRRAVLTRRAEGAAGGEGAARIPAYGTRSGARSQTSLLPTRNRTSNQRHRALQTSWVVSSVFFIPPCWKRRNCIYTTNHLWPIIIWPVKPFETVLWLRAIQIKLNWIGQTWCHISWWMRMLMCALFTAAQPFIRNWTHEHIVLTHTDVHAHTYGVLL